jgi:Zn-dependent M28 family amino/carboxypeptidase
MKNIIGELTGERPDIVIIAGHYDTKSMDGFVGANDGGSSAAAVLEMARVSAKTRPEYTLWFTFFDGEEAVVDWSANDGTDNTYGSRRLADRLDQDGTLSKVKAVLLVDMIGDRDLDIKRDAVSTPWLVDLIWATAGRLGYGRYFLGNETAIEDDHIPFKERGVPAIDIIDFNYGPNNSYWHTRQDTLDKVSAESMKVVGDVILVSLPELFKRIGEKRPAGASR